MTPKEYQMILAGYEEIIEICRQKIFEARIQSETCPTPTKRRPATAQDIILDAIIWHEKGDDGKDWWSIVEEILDPSDSFKAYIFEGCRYGLDCAYVEVLDE